jgi:hypothetical protein
MVKNMTDNGNKIKNMEKGNFMVIKGKYMKDNG